MYSKNDGYIYFDNKEEATKQQRADGKNAKKLWEILNPFGGWDDMLSESFRFDLDMSHYRRRLASEFRARTDFREDDPVCWCGVNGLVGKIRNDRQYYVEAVFKNQLATFTSSGHHYDWHTKPSLFHGHDVLRAEDQKFPVERVAEPKEKPDNIRKANEVAECTPHWKKNLEHARNGEWNLIDRSAFSCPLCLKYIQKGWVCESQTGQNINQHRKKGQKGGDDDFRQYPKSQPDRQQRRNRHKRGGFYQDREGHHTSLQARPET